MIEGMPRSHDNVLGFRVSGDVTRADYEILEPAVQTVVEASGSVRLLLDMSALHGEKLEACGPAFRQEVPSLDRTNGSGRSSRVEEVADPAH